MVAEATKSLTEHENRVSEIRSQIEILNQAIEKMGGSAASPAKRRGRPRKNAAAPAAPAPAATKKPKKRAKNKMPLNRLVCEILSKSEKGMQLKEVVKAAMDSGYKSTAKTPFSSLVSQALWNLKNDENPVVIREDESKRYRLVEKAA